MMASVESAVPFVEPPPMPASFVPGWWTLVMIVAMSLAGGYFVWMVFWGQLRVRGGKQPIRAVLEAALVLALVTGGWIAFFMAGQNRADDRRAEHDAVVSALTAGVGPSLERHYGIEFASYLYVPLSRTGEQPVEVRTDAGEQDCFVHVVGDRYAVSCGGVDAASSTELPAAD